MSDLYSKWIEKAQGQKGSFITKDGRVIFVGGPGSGGGGSGGGVEIPIPIPGSGTPENPAKGIGVSESSRMLRGEDVNNAPELTAKVMTHKGVYIINSGNVFATVSVQPTLKGEVFSATVIDRATNEVNQLGHFVSPVDALATIQLGMDRP